MTLYVWYGWKKAISELEMICWNGKERLRDFGVLPPHHGEDDH